MDVQGSGIAVSGPIHALAYGASVQIKNNTEKLMSKTLVSDQGAFVLTTVVHYTIFSGMERYCMHI